MKKRLIGYYDYTVVLTYCGMLFAFGGILCVMNQDFRLAVICLMAAGLCDMFDGAVASTKERTTAAKRFGIQIDSLSDLISFGILPAVFTYVIDDRKPFVGAVCAAFALCALIRLAYYNVMEEERQNITDGKRKCFLGVPVTTIAVLLPAVFFLFEDHWLHNAAVFPTLLAVTALGFVCPIEIPKPQLLGKFVLLLVGLLEAVGVLFILGWGAV